MKMKITASIYVETGSTDPEDVARDFDIGLLRAVDSFPGAEVVSAEVEGIDEAKEPHELDYFEK